MLGFAVATALLLAGAVPEAGAPVADPQPPPGPPAAEAPPERAAVAVDPALAPPAARASPDLRPRLVVAGLDDLDRLATDPEVGRRVDELRARRRHAVLGLVVAGTGVSVASFLAVLAQATAATANIGVVTGCSAVGATCPARAKPDYGPAYVTLGISAGIAVLSLVFWPRDADVRGVVDAWNGRHPDDRAELVTGWRASADAGERPSD
ncbi:MAG TPA: hypothetical protein VFP50_03360 [Anaeromyxobacteraceae bacterium]|nr:hypothetical protein [Anaeromyxobacteraceae bacterium]